MCCEHSFISTGIYPSYMYVFHCLVLVTEHCDIAKTVSIPWIHKLSEES